MTKRMNVSCCTEKLKSIRSFISDSIGVSLPIEERDMVVLAVDEVCANLMRHSPKREEESISIEVMVNDISNEISFEIKDIGTLFDYSNYQEPLLGDIVKQKRKGGLGMILVRRIMDSIEFYKDGDHNICKLTKKTPSLN